MKDRGKWRAENQIALIQAGFRSRGPQAASSRLRCAYIVGMRVDFKAIALTLTIVSFVTNLLNQR
jgi:hypothetical protein